MPGAAPGQKAASDPKAAPTPTAAGADITKSD
jgi:hypothetical protein